jgi:hypothetical protein
MNYVLTLYLPEDEAHEMALENIGEDDDAAIMATIRDYGHVVKLERVEEVR